MAGTRFNSRQTTHRALLKALYPQLPADGKELDDILESIDDELTMPLRMLQNFPADRILNIENIIVENSETGRKRTIPPIANLLPAFTSGTVEFPATSGGTIVVTPGTDATLTLTDNYYIKVGINLDATGDLNLTFGQEATTITNATNPPTVPNTFAIGYVIIWNNGGSIYNVVNSYIYQYVGGGGGGSGTGDANSFLETLKNMLQDSVYELTTPIIFSIDADSFVDGSSTGSYSLVSNTFEMASGETFVSTQLLDSAEFLDEGLDVKEVDLAVKWASGNIDESATYEVSRDGGVNWQTASLMRVGDGTSTWVGAHRFTEESSFSSIVSDSSTGFAAVLSDSSQQSLAMEFTLSSAAVLNKASIEMTKTGSPNGYLWISIAEDDSGVPGTVVGESQAVAVSGISTGTVEVTLPDIPLQAGTYHYILRTDADYKASYSVGVTQISIDANSSSSGASRFDGTSWTDFTNYALNFDLEGRALDVRVRITASAADKALEGLGLFYNHQTGEVITGLKNIEVFKFKAVADNDNEFTLTRFTPDPDLLKCYYVEAGQVFVRNAFELQGNKIVFPVDTFNNGGVEADVTLIFQQIEGSGFDNSDSNALLLSENHLGSQDATIDRSANGRGIFLRTPSGELVELTIKDDYSIAIYSV
jgi:hypothetical protein